MGGAGVVFHSHILSSVHTPLQIARQAQLEASAAREEQQRLERRALELEQILRCATESDVEGKY
jgi:hypothetical protein